MYSSFRAWARRAQQFDQTQLKALMDRRIHSVFTITAQKELGAKQPLLQDDCCTRHILGSFWSRRLGAPDTWVP